MHSRILTIALLLPLITAAPGQLARAQSASDGLVQEVRVNGLVIDRQKYSFTLQSLDRNHKVTIPNGTPMLMKLTKPKFDLQQRTISLALMLSARDGIPEHDQVLSFPLADPVYVSTTFRDAQEMKRVMEKQIRYLDRYTISSRPIEKTPLSFGGELSESRTPGRYFVNDNGAIHSVQLGSRRGLLSGFTIMDLRPLQTSVWVQGAMDGETVVASRIRFEYLGNPAEGFDVALPNLLSLGDITSYDYQRPLIEALDGKFNVHHPPAWNGPSSSWDRLHHFVGNLQSGEPTWDVIVFNYGIRDDSESRDVYQQNLRNAIKLLKKTRARLVWVNSTPIPNGFSSGNPNQPLTGRVQGRMHLQNRWAADVMTEFPEVLVCDLWQVVKDDDQGVYKNWWTDKAINFDYAQSIPLGRKVAKSVLTASGSSAEPNPMSAHDLNDSVSSR